MKDWGQGKGKWEEGEYLGPGILWLTEMQGSLAVRLDPESVIICFWGHKEPTEPCSVTQRNIGSSESNQGLNHWPSEWFRLYFVLLYDNEEETLDCCTTGLASVPWKQLWRPTSLNISTHPFTSATAPLPSHPLWQSGSPSIGLSGGFAENLPHTAVRGLVPGRSSINSKHYSYY